MGFLETPGSLQVRGGKGEGPEVIGHCGAGMPASLLMKASTGFQREGFLPPCYAASPPMY